MKNQLKDKIIEAVSLVPKGYVVSYSQIALMVGIPRGARIVGQILSKLENSQIPWWRVINNAGRISIKGENLYLQIAQKEKLEHENIVVGKNLDIKIEKYRFRPTPDILKKLNLDEKYIELMMEKYSF